MATLELFANQVTTTVTSGGTTAPSAGTSETWTVSSSAGFPAASSTGSPPSFFRGTDPAASSEKFLVTNVSGTTWTVTRGAEGTTPVAHSSGFTVQNVITAGALSAFAQIPSLRNRGAVAPSTAYVPGDIVFYSGQHVLITTAVTSGSWSAWNSPPTLTSGTYLPMDGVGVWEASDWGVTGDAGTTDNAPILNKMMARMWGAGQGGIVMLPPGDIGAWMQLGSTVIIPPKCILAGQGIEGSVLKLASGVNADAVQFMQYNSTAQATILSAATGITIAASSLQNAFYAGAMNLCVDGNAFGQSASDYHSGINMTTNPTSSTATSDPDFDPTNILLNVEVRQASGDGFTHSGRGQLRVTNCVFRYCNGWGAVPSFDSLYLGCNFAENGIGGAYIANASCNGAANKQFNNGTNAQWVASTPYTAGTPVMYLGGLYVCSANVTSATVPSTDTSHWAHITGATQPAYWGYGLVFDGSSENTWEGNDGQQNSAGDYYLHSTTGVRVSGNSKQPNFNQGTGSQNGTNPSNYASLTLDGATGCQADIVATGLSTSAFPLRAINTPVRCDVRMTGDNTVSAALSSDSGTIAGTANSIWWNGASLTGLVASVDGTATSGGNIALSPVSETFGFIGIYSTALGGYSYFVPNISTAHWAPCIGGAGGHGIGVCGSTSGLGDVAFGVLNFSQTGGFGLGNATFTCLDGNQVYTFHNTLDDGSGNAVLTGTLNGGVPDTEQFTCLSSSRTFTNNTSAQAVFNATANGAFTAAASTSYFFEAEFDITGLSGSSHTVSFTLGGTATYTSVKYLADVLSPFTAGTFASWPRAIFTAATIQTFVAAGTNTSVAVRIRGILRVNGSGTVIPQITQGTASAAAVVSANSWMRLTPVGSNTVTSVGSWT